jgi:uncharacterized MAPEG superfamily protein
MSPLVCLVLFAVWAMVLVLCIGAVRVFQVLTGKKRANEFPSGVPHGGDAYWRLNRAHINTLENLPIFAALVLAAALLHVELGRLPLVVICARVVQSLFHISSGRSLVVNLRFTAYSVQLGCFGWMATAILRRAL